MSDSKYPIGWDQSRVQRVVAQYEQKIVTDLSPASTYFPAEKYHQDYFTKNPGAGYCQAVVAAKVAKARTVFFEKYSRV